MSKFKEPGKRYRAEDYLGYNERKRIRLSWVINLIIFLAVLIWGIFLMPVISIRGEVGQESYFIGLMVLCILALLIHEIFKPKEFGAKKNLMSLVGYGGFYRSLWISLVVYFILAWVFSYARHWSVFGYYAVCCLFGGMMAFVCATGLSLIAVQKQRKRNKTSRT